MKLFVSLVLMLIGPPISGFVFMKFWAWFVVPPFHTAPLSHAHAIGLSLFVGLLLSTVTVLLITVTNKRVKDLDGETKGLVATSLTLVVQAMSLFVGWLWSLAIA